jgi:hypothetical protein
MLLLVCLFTTYAAAAEVPTAPSNVEALCNAAVAAPHGDAPDEARAVYNFLAGAAVSNVDVCCTVCTVATEAALNASFLCSQTNPETGHLLHLAKCISWALCGFISPNIECPTGFFCQFGGVTPAGSSGLLNFNAPKDPWRRQEKKKMSCPSAGTPDYTHVNELQCPAGSLCPCVTTRLPCPAGYFCPGGTARVAGVEQLRCKPGFYCPEGTAAPDGGAFTAAPRPGGPPVFSPKGHFCATPATSEPCPAGSFCPYPTTVPIPCSALNSCAAGSRSPKTGGWQIALALGLFCCTLGPFFFLSFQVVGVDRW